MLEKNILGVIKDDMNELVHRLNFHQEGYMRVFSLERTRKHFDEIFYSRYNTISGSDLALIDNEHLQIISKFYHEVLDLFLYFKMTEDMPSAVTNKLSTSLKLINDIHTEFVDKVIKMDLLGSSEDEDADSEKESESVDDVLNIELESEEEKPIKDEDEEEELTAAISIDELEEDPPPFVK
tara:strand:+ start:1328 stop:1870 length:543 start_codon:yes stop_codon:yes gene_type:complete